MFRLVGITLLASFASTVRGRIFANTETGSSFRDVQVATTNPAGVNLGAVLCNLAFGAGWFEKHTFSSITRESVVITVFTPEGQMTNKTVMFSDIDQDWSTDILWPGAIANAVAQAGWPTVNGHLVSMSVPHAIKAVMGTHVMSPSYTAGDTGDASDGDNVRQLFEFMVGSASTKAVILQTKDETSELKHNYAYSVAGWSDTTFTLHDPSIEGKKGFEVSSKKVFDDIAFIFAGIAE